MDDTFIQKGDRIQACWLKAKPMGTYSLAGVQEKYAVDSVSVTGIVRHVRTDDPVLRTTIRLYIDPDGDWEGPTVDLVGCT